MVENEDIWINMGERLNVNPAKWPLLDPVLELLESMYTLEQAKLVTDIPLGKHTAKDLAKMLNRDEAEVQKLLDEMDKNMTIFALKNENGVKEYSVIPFEFGLFEPGLILGKKGDPKTEKHMATVKAVFAAQEIAIKAFFQNAPDMAKQALSDPHMRYLPVEEIVPSDGSVILSEEKVTEILNKSTSFCLLPCGCRRLAKLEGHPCQNPGEDDYCCIQTDESADWLIEKGVGKRVTKEELLGLMQKFKKAGMLQLAGSYAGPGGFCNCCKCCCFHREMGRKMREFGVKLAKNTFLAKLDLEKCNGCEACINICPMDAITLSGDKVSLDLDICAGCGHCVTNCPTGAMTMIRVAEPKLHEHEHVKVGLGY